MKNREKSTRMVVLWVNGTDKDAYIAAENVCSELEKMDILCSISNSDQNRIEIVTPHVIVDVKWRSGQLRYGSLYHQTFVYDGKKPVWLVLHKGYTEPSFHGTLVNYIIECEKGDK